jgi:hypothetical protein
VNSLFLHGNGEIPDEIWVEDKLLARGGETTLSELYSRMLLLGMVSGDYIEATHGSGLSLIEIKDTPID